MKVAFKKRTTPYKHPPLRQGYTRIELPGIETETPKAILFRFEANVLIWVPKSQCKILWGRGSLKGDDGDALDITNSFYDEKIKNKLL